MVEGMNDRTHVDTVVIGGGQAGLAVGRELGARGLDCLILEANAHVGDSWQARWDSLCLFTPAEHDGLPGLPFPAPKGSFPTKGEVAAYLRRYVDVHGLTVRPGTRVTALTGVEDGWRVETSGGTFIARNVVVATGTNSHPQIPQFAAGLDPSILQLHSSTYRNPASVPPGDVLVVGAGTSGAEIALELAPTHRVSLAGRPTVHVPDLILRRAGGLYWRFVHHVLTRGTPIGRKAAAGFGSRGAPLIRISMRSLETAGVTRLPRVSGVSEGWPLLADGGVARVGSIVWATGYRPDFGWIDDLPVRADGWPVEERGVVASRPGLYFVGIPFQYALTSGLIGGVGRDATWVADRIAILAGRAERDGTANRERIP